MSTYFEKLRDPRWQKTRLEVMERDDFCCTSCGSGARTLNVHHRYYCSKREPWDYPLWSLLTLCEDCHEEARVADAWTEIEETIGNLLFVAGGPLGVARLRYTSQVAREAREMKDVSMRSPHYDQEWAHVSAIFAALVMLHAHNRDGHYLVQRIQQAIFEHCEALREQSRG